jgi:hypothetical protein
MNTLNKIRKRHDNDTKFTTKREKQGRWWWVGMHKRCHDDRATLLATIETIREVYIDEHKRWATTCGDSSCCSCMDLLAVLDALNDVLEIHGRPITYEGVPIEWGFHT